METIRLILDILYWLLVSVGILMGILQTTKVFKTEKQLDNANKVIAETERIKFLTEKIKELAVIAEENGGTGKEKKVFVVSAIKEICLEYDIPYSEIFVSKLIDELIDLTKKINSK